MCSCSSADSIAGGSNDEEIYAEEVVEDEGGSELVLVPRRAWRDLVSQATPLACKSVGTRLGDEQDGHLCYFLCFNLVHFVKQQAHPLSSGRTSDQLLRFQRGHTDL